MKQRNLFNLSDYKSDFGGALLSKKRKSRRPLSSKNAMHLVLRANISRSSNSGSLLKHRAKIEAAFERYALKFNIRIYKKAIVSNHIHVVVLFGSRKQYVMFIRSFSGVLARQLKIKWALRPWTRLLKWGFDFKSVISYVLQNQLEAERIISYQKRGRSSLYLSSHPDGQRLPSIYQPTESRLPAITQFITNPKKQ